ncbi:cytochrome P450, partial [Pleurotus eryngii]
AAKLEARPIPKLRGRWFANLDILKQMNWHFSNGYLGDGLTQILKKYGNMFNFHVLWSEGIFTICPEHIKLILATDFNNYERGPRFIETIAPVLGTGVFNSDGSMWKFHQSMTRPFFSCNRISHFNLFDRHAEVLISQMKERSSIEVGIDVQDLMGRFTLDSAMEFLFGSCVDSLNGKLPFPHHMDLACLASLDRHQAVDERFPRAFLQAMEAVSQCERLGPIWPLWEMFGDAMKEPMGVINAFIDPIIQDALHKKGTKDMEKGILRGQNIKLEEDTNNAEVDDDVTLLDHLALSPTHCNNDIINSLISDPVMLKDETLNIMLAGRDTTATTLTILVYFLATP